MHSKKERSLLLSLTLYLLYLSVLVLLFMLMLLNFRLCYFETSLFKLLRSVLNALRPHMANRRTRPGYTQLLTDARIHLFYLYSSELFTWQY